MSKPLSEETKQKALEKVAEIDKTIAYLEQALDDANAARREIINYFNLNKE